MRHSHSPAVQYENTRMNTTTRHPTIGRVHLVGAGPGDPELLTLRAARLLQQCTALVYDQLVSPAVLELVNPAARRIYVGKQAGNHTLPQAEINDLLVQLAHEGLDVVRLKGGDPLIFGRGGEEIEELLSHGVRCEVVPGITAASGMAAYTGIPLTHRDHAQSCVFVTGHLQDDSIDLDWPSLARPHQTVVVYMGLSALEIICRQLIAHGLSADTPAAVVRQATLPDQQVVTATLATLATASQAAGLKSPALIVVGEVVALHERLSPALLSVEERLRASAEELIATSQLGTGVAASHRAQPASVTPS